MWQYSDALRALYETPSLNHPDDDRTASKPAADLLQRVLQSGRRLLTEAESKRLLAIYGIPTVETASATSAAEAVQCARKIGYPVVLKLLSNTITHKTDVGGVKLNLQTESDVSMAYEAIANSVEKTAGPGHFDGVTVQPMIRRSGYELILGSKIDPQFGPVLLFGSGGQLVEIYRDRALALPPLTSTLARRMMERTKIYRALQGIRGQKPIDLTALEQILVRFGQLVLEQPRISEIDINPLLASGDGLLALDARVVMHPSTCADTDLPRPVIRPYPRQYVGQWTAADGRKLLIRPIRPEDEPLLKTFHESLSAQSVYSRYAQALSLNQRTVHDRLARLCFIDYDRQIALVAIDEQQTEPRIVGVSRLIKLHGTGAYQRLGLGSQLMSQLRLIARDEKLQRMIGQISSGNRAMLAICQRMGFEMAESPDRMTQYASLQV
jgi:acetyltransferase